MCTLKSTLQYLEEKNWDIFRAHLPAVVHVGWQNTPGEELPPSLSSLRALRSLTIGRFNTNIIPDITLNLPNLRRLSIPMLSHTLPSTWFDSLATLTHIDHLVLSGVTTGRYKETIHSLTILTLSRLPPNLTTLTICRGDQSLNPVIPNALYEALGDKIISNKLSRINIQTGIQGWQSRFSVVAVQQFDSQRDEFARGGIIVEVVEGEVRNEYLSSAML